MILMILSHVHVILCLDNKNSKNSLMVLFIASGVLPGQERPFCGGTAHSVLNNTR